MDFWIVERASVQQRISELENKIALMHMQKSGTTSRFRLLEVLRETLSRTKLHAEYVERRIAAHQSDADKRSARATLVQALTTKHSQSRGPATPTKILNVRTKAASNPTLQQPR